MMGLQNRNPAFGQFRNFRNALDGGVEAALLIRHPASIRGALRGRHGRWVRDAVDAAVPGGRIARQTNGADADGEVVWS